MRKDHPNLDVLKRLDITDALSRDRLFHPDVVWHYYNSKAPELNGEYQGVEGIVDFLEQLNDLTHGTFRISPVDACSVGCELVLAQTRNSFSVRGTKTEFDVVTVWRILDGKIAEVWDIPAVNTVSLIASD